MNKKIVLNDDSGSPVEVDLKIFIDHINHYHKNDSIHEEGAHKFTVNKTFREKLKKMSEKLVKDILNVYGYTSARVVIREDIDSDQLVDFLTGNKTYAKSITALNKIDLVDKKFLKKVSKKLKTEFIPVSADANDNIAELRDKIYDELQFIRIYMRPKGGKTDYKEPLIIRKGNSILDVCNKLHRKLKRDFRYGLVWGKSVKFAGQRVGRNHVLYDEDVLTIIKIKGT